LLEGQEGYMKRFWLTVFFAGLGGGVAWAQLVPPHQSVDPGSPRSSELSSQASEDLVRGRAAEALQAADKAIAADPRNPWGHYNKGAALTELGRTDDAVAEFTRAQQSFSTADAWGHSIAIYGRANAFAQVGRCAEAQPAFEEFATFVQSSDPRAAAMAREYAKNCNPPAH
jgi:tetratricopeptide (TPR) repeat protein